MNTALYLPSWFGEAQPAPPSRKYGFCQRCGGMKDVRMGSETISIGCAMTRPINGTVHWRICADCARQGWRVDSSAHALRFHNLLGEGVQFAEPRTVVA